MRGVELRHLTTLAAISEVGSFGRAASQLGYTQSTVSQHIAALEHAVGGAVFDRPGGPTPVRITALGSVVLKHGRSLLADADRLADAVDRFKAGDGRVDIGTFQSVSNTFLPTLVRRLRNEQPACDIRLSEGESEDPDIGDLDVLFHDGQVRGKVEHTKLLDDPYVLVTRPGDFPDGPTTIADLDDVALIAWPAICDQPRLEQELLDGGARPRIVFRTAANETILSMVRGGLGAAILPWLALHGSDVWSDERLQFHELQPSTARQIYVHWPAGRSRSPLAIRTIEIAVEIAQELTEQRDSQ